MIYGGHGDDAINGYAGNDTYVWARGDGNDVVTEETWCGDGDRLVLSGVASTAVTVVRSGEDVRIVIAESTAGAGDGGSVLLKASLDEFRDQGVETIVFADGTTWSRADLRSNLLAQSSTTGNDTILGYNVADTITGGHGDDVVNGYAGNDTYVWARGDGNDVVTEETWCGDGDRLVLSGVASTAVTVVRSGEDVRIVIAESAAGAGDGGSVLLKASLDEFRDQGVETIVFADGTTWSRADLRSKLLAQSSTSGNDTIYGYNVADTITGGHGDDVVNGYAGNDTYVWVRGDGNDVVTEEEWCGDGDRLVLSGVASTAVTAVRSGGDLLVVVAESAVGAGDGGSVFLKASLDDFRAQGVEEIAFADGTIWDRAAMRSHVARVVDTLVAGSSSAETLTGTALSDLLLGGGGGDDLVGGGGDDLLLGGDGGDHLDGGEGNDLLDGGAGTADWVSYWDAAAGVSLDLQNGVASGAATGDDTVLGIENVWATQYDDALVGNAADNELHGWDGNDHLDGGLGDDYLDGGDGTGDWVTYWDAASGVTIDLAAGTATGSGSGNDTLVGIENVWATQFDDILVGDAGNNELHGWDGKDQLNGGLGDDYLDGGEGTEDWASYWDASSGVAVDLAAGTASGSGSGNDTIVDIENVSATSFDDTLVGSAADNELYGSDGNDTLSGLAGDDYLNGGEGADVLVGSLGADDLVGGNGDDLYRYASGDGRDTIDDDGGSADRLVFADLTASDVRLLVVGDDLQIDVLGTGEQITDTGHFTSSTRGIDQIAFAGGTVWSRADMSSHLAA